MPVRVLAAAISCLALLGIAPVHATVGQASPSSTDVRVRSDFNGDGFADLAVGVISEDLGAVVYAGAVNVIYGSSGGLQADSPPDEFWHQDSPGIEDVAEDFDQFGSALVAGDFNSDGFADLAVGAFAEDIGSIQLAGSVNVLYGSPQGLQVDFPPDQFWHQDTAGVEDAAEIYDKLGADLSSGDFNSDGFADLAIGVYAEGIGNVETAGAVNVLYGSPLGLQVDSPPDQFWHQDSPGVEDLAEREDRFGSSLTAGDFNMDGFFDLAVGVPTEGVGRIAAAGAVNVLYGANGGLQGDSPPDQFWHQDSPEVDDFAEGFDHFGARLTSGDFNRDGYADLAIGVYVEDLEAISVYREAGAVSVLHGSGMGLQADFPPDQFWHQATPGVEDGPEREDFFGVSLAVGDFNADGFGDLAIGVAGEAQERAIGSLWMAGAVHVLYGSAAGLQTDSPSDQFWHQDSPGVEDIAEQGDSFGNSLAVADFNRDAFADLAAGASLEGLRNIGVAGAANVLYGSERGVQVEAPPDQFWHQDSPEVEDAAEEGDQFGYSLA